MRPTGFLGSDLLTPGTPTSVSVDSSVRLIGEDGWYGGVDVANNSGEYTIEAQVLDLTNQDRISGNRLAAASTVYPKEITDLYTQIPDQAIGPDAQLLLDTIKGLADTDNPYELAKFMETYLRGKQFVYSIDLRDQPCDSPSAVECFARYKHGLLPALRLDDGDPAARGEPREPHPDEGRRGVPPGGAAPTAWSA